MFELDYMNNRNIIVVNVMSKNVQNIMQRDKYTFTYKLR